VKRRITGFAVVAAVLAGAMCLGPTAYAATADDPLDTAGAPGAGSSEQGPAYSSYTSSIGQGTLTTVHTESGFTEDGTAYFRQDVMDLGPLGITRSSVSTHS
jgi:ABC-type phosphate transport system substrate-binding protein